MHAGATRNIGIQHHQFGEFIAQRGQSLAESFA
jgi:hypothetical protein